MIDIYTHRLAMGVGGFLIGNTAEEVLNQVDCPVLTVKPEGFVTPVTLVDK